MRKRNKSAAVRIPASVLHASHLDPNELVVQREEDGRILIEPIRRKTCDLSELLNGINANNLHDAIDFGAAAGKEVL